MIRAVIIVGLFVAAGCGAIETRPMDIAGEERVGYAALEFRDPERADRRVPVRFWYPADARDQASGEEVFYLLRDLGVGKIGIRSTVARSGLRVRAGGDLPLILFSHGWGSGAFEAVPIAEMLASRGFAVASISHAGNTYEDETFARGGSYDSPAVDRPKDVRFVLDRIAAVNRGPGPFRGAFDMQRVGMIGHSYGAYTAVAAVVGHGVEKETRLKAILPVVPAFDDFIDQELAAVDRPVLLLGGGADDVCPIERNLFRGELVMNPPFIATVLIHGASHYHFSNSKEIGDTLVAAGLSRGLWSFFGAERLEHAYLESTRPGSPSVERVHRIESFYAFAFFSRFLRGETDYDLQLDPRCAAAIMPEVTVRVRSALKD